MDNAESRKSILKSNENLQKEVCARETLADFLFVSDANLMREKLEEWVRIYS